MIYRMKQPEIGHSLVVSGEPLQRATDQVARTRENFPKNEILSPTQQIKPLFHGVFLTAIEICHCEIGLRAKTGELVI